MVSLKTREGNGFKIRARIVGSKSRRPVSFFTQYFSNLMIIYVPKTKVTLCPTGGHKDCDDETYISRLNFVLNYRISARDISKINSINRQNHNE